MLKGIRDGIVKLWINFSSEYTVKIERITTHIVAKSSNKSTRHKNNRLKFPGKCYIYIEYDIIYSLPIPREYHIQYYTIAKTNGNYTHAMQWLNIILLFRKKKSCCCISFFNRKLRKHRKHTCTRTKYIAYNMTYSFIRVHVRFSPKL